MKKILLILLVLAIALPIGATNYAYYNINFKIDNRPWTPAHYYLYLVCDFVRIDTVLGAYNTDSVLSDSIGFLDSCNQMYFELMLIDEDVIGGSGRDSIIIPIEALENIVNISAPVATNASTVYLHARDLPGYSITKKVEVKVVLQHDERVVMDTCNNTYVLQYEAWAGQPDSNGLIEIELRYSSCYDDPNMLYHATVQVGGRRGNTYDMGDFYVRDSASQMLKIE